MKEVEFQKIKKANHIILKMQKKQGNGILDQKKERKKADIAIKKENKLLYIRLVIKEYFCGIIFQI